jgi:hypothetical protein
MNRLIAIQQKLKAPKNQKNTFGGYSYRSCEDILEAVKPLLAEQNLVLVISDEVISIDGGFEVSEFSKDEKNKKEASKHTIASNRVYIKATARLFDETGKEIVSTSAVAREEETKKGMDYAQLTGATSSYARKYALNGLFAIDDNKDSDSTNTHGKEVEKQKPTNKSAAEELLPPENKKTTTKIDDDFDLLEELKNKKDIANLTKFFNDNQKNAKNKAEFLKEFQKCRRKLQKGA